MGSVGRAAPKDVGRSLIDTLPISETGNAICSMEQFIIDDIELFNNYVDIRINTYLQGGPNSAWNSEENFEKEKAGGPNNA